MRDINRIKKWTTEEIHKDFDSFKFYWQLSKGFRYLNRDYLNIYRILPGITPRDEYQKLLNNSFTEEEMEEINEYLKEYYEWEHVYKVIEGQMKGKIIARRRPRKTPKSRA